MCARAGLTRAFARISAAQGGFARALASQWSATVYCGVVATLVSFALGRALGPEAFGGYNFVLTIASLFAILQDGGFTPLIFRETARPSAGLAPPAPLLSLGMGHALAFTGLGALLAWPLDTPVKPALLCALAYYALFCWGNFFSASLKGQGLFEADARWRILVRTATAAGIGLSLCLPGADAAYVFAGMLAGQALALLAPMARPLRTRPRLSPDAALYRKCGSFLVISAATTLYFKSDIILLTAFTGDNAQVGQYAAAYRLVEAAVLFVTPLSHLFFRKLRLSLHAPGAFHRSFKTMLAVMTGLAASGTSLAIWAGPYVIEMAFGARFGPAQELCPWLLPALFFILPNAILTQALVALGRESFYARLTMATAGVNIALNLALVPFFGAKGSAAATVATEALLTAGLAWGYSRRNLP